MPTAFVSDLHLCAERPAQVALFQRFMDHAAGAFERLYILGDLFEYWLGDDDDTEPNGAIVAALARYCSAGGRLYVMRGNRDFLIGEDFARATGCSLLPDRCVDTFAGIRMLLMHGDLLCTSDHDYQQLRATIQTPGWREAVLRRPLAERRKLAGDLRAGSRAAMQSKPEHIMDADPEAIRMELDVHAVHCLVHGHTHRAAVHEFVHRGARATRIVLGDWYASDSVLVMGDDGDRRLMRVVDLLEG